MKTDTVQVRFKCKCGKHESWIGDGGMTGSCPECGRIYRGEEKFNKRRGAFEIKVFEIKGPGWR